MIRKLIKSTCALLLLIPLFLSAEMINEIKGNWTGTCYKGNDSFTTTIVISNYKYTIHYPSSGCGGSLYLKTMSKNEVVFLEDLSYGQRSCISNRTIKIKTIDATSIRYEAYDKKNTKIAEGILHKESDSKQNSLFAITEIKTKKPSENVIGSKDKKVEHQLKQPHQTKNNSKLQKVLDSEVIGLTPLEETRQTFKNGKLYTEKTLKKPSVYIASILADGNDEEGNKRWEYKDNTGQVLKLYLDEGTGNYFKLIGKAGTHIYVSFGFNVDKMRYLFILDVKRDGESPIARSMIIGKFNYR